MLFQDPVLERLSGQDWQDAIDAFISRTGSFITCGRETLGSTVSWEPRYWGIPMGLLTLAPRPGGGYELAADPRGGYIPHPPNPKFDQLLAQLDAALVERARRVPAPAVNLPKSVKGQERWRRIWQKVKPHVHLTYNEILGKLAQYDPDLVVDEDTLSKVIRAGMAGML